MLLRNLLLLSISFLLNSCNHGLNLNVCISDPDASQFECNTKKGHASILAFSDSDGYSVYSPHSYQVLLDYCAARNQAGTAAPEFDSCLSVPGAKGFDCVVQSCEINAQENGAVCTWSKPYFVSYAQSENFIGLSDSDNTALLAFCNVSLNKIEVLLK